MYRSKQIDAQLDDVWMPESTHIFYFALHSVLCSRSIYDLLRNKLHGDFVTRKCMCRHCRVLIRTSPVYTNGARHVLLTFPNVPSAISDITVYSPSLEAGTGLMGSASGMLAEKDRGRVWGRWRNVVVWILFGDRDNISLAR